MTKMTPLWKYEDHYQDAAIELNRGDDGIYYVTVDQFKPHGESNTIALPSAKCDELRVALIAGFDPKRDNSPTPPIEQPGPHHDN